MSMPKILRDLRDVKDESITATSATVSNGSLVLTTPVEVSTGSVVKFIAPCDCSSVTSGIKIGNDTYSLVDTRGNTASDAWVSGSLISVLLDCSSKKAYVQLSSSSSDSSESDDKIKEALRIANEAKDAAGAAQDVANEAKDAAGAAQDVANEAKDAINRISLSVDSECILYLNKE